MMDRARAVAMDVARDRARAAMVARKAPVVQVVQVVRVVMA
jgi:hypothetical protein